MLQELRVLHVISSRNGRYRPQAYSWPEVAIGQKRPVKVPTKLGAVQCPAASSRLLSMVVVRFWPIEACRDGLQSVNYVASKEVVNV